MRFTLTKNEMKRILNTIKRLFQHKHSGNDWLRKEDVIRQLEGQRVVATLNASAELNEEVFTQAWTGAVGDCIKTVEDMKDA